jgi:hypothetical protein
MTGAEPDMLAEAGIPRDADTQADEATAACPRHP